MKNEERSRAKAAAEWQALKFDAGYGAIAWGEHVLGAPGYHIAGGSDEIQRNIIAERVLELPPEPR